MHQWRMGLACVLVGTGFGSAFLLSCADRAAPVSERPLCFDSFHLRVIDGEGRTGPIKGELRTPRETVAFACPHSDPSVAYRCWDDGTVTLSFGPRWDHERSIGGVWLVVWEHPRPDTGVHANDGG